MNDLAEAALARLDRARRAVAARPVPLLAVAGFVLAAAVVVTGARIGAVPAAVPVNRWLGLLPPPDYQLTGLVLPVTMSACIAALVLLWLVTLRVANLRHLRARAVAGLAVAWAAPFAVGPPLLSTDVFGYVARGLLARNGRSPYHHAIDALGGSRIVLAVDPVWRGTRSSDGPLASLLEHVVVSVSGGQAIVAVVVFRVIAVLAVVAVGVLAAELSGGRRAAALGLTVLNPAVLLFVVSAAQLVGVLVALLLAVLVAAAQRRWLLAVLLCCVAAGLKPVALVALPAVVAVHAAGYAWRPALRRVARDVVVAAVLLTGAVFAVPYGWGWLANLGDAIHPHVAVAPASVAGQLVGVIVAPASYDDLAAGGRIAAVAAGVAVLGYLYVTARNRPLDRTLGYAFVAAGTLAPVVYPALLMWGALLLAPAARGARRDWVIALGCAACVLTPLGFGTRTAVTITSVALGAVAVVLVPRLVVRARHAPVRGAAIGLRRR